MAIDFDKDDPLGALMSEWSQMALGFWIGLAAALALALLLPEIAWVVGLGLIGVILMQLGNTVVVVGNELRKEFSRRPAKGPETD